MARNRINSTTADHPKGFGGPVVDGNNNVYVLRSTSIWKAGTDPLVDTWSVQDDANDPAMGVSDGEVAIWQEGTELHFIGYDNGSSQYEYSIFRTSDHASADTWGLTDELVESPANAPITPGCFISVRSDGDVIVVYNGDTDKIMGTDYDRCDYARREGGTWTTGINVAGDGLEGHRRASGIGRGESDKMWLQYGKATVGGFLKDLSSTNTLGSELEINSIGGQFASLVPYYDDGGVEVMTTARLHATSDLRSRQTRDGTLQTELFLSGTDFDAIAVPRVAVDGTDAYVVYRSDTDDDIKYQKSADGAAWGDITTVSTATSPNRLTCNVIDHGGGKVLAVAYFEQSGTTGQYYDEISIAVPKSDPPRNRPNEKHIHLLRR